MAGHSKWANTKFRKSAQDDKRGKLFTKLIREISVAAKIGGADPATNARLRSAIERGLDNNLTKDAIDRAIKKVVGGEEKNLEEITYEGYAPFGVAIIVECLTDNRTRTVSEVRHAFTKHGGNLGVNGCVSYLFDHSNGQPVPTYLVNLPSEEAKEKITKMLDYLENLDDVHNVYSNAELGE